MTSNSDLGQDAANHVDPPGQQTTDVESGDDSFDNPFTIDDDDHPNTPNETASLTAAGQTGQTNGVTKRPVDPPESYSHPESYDDDTEEYVHDQLPTVEEIKGSYTHSNDKSLGFIHFFALFGGLILVTLAIVLPITLGPNKSSNRSPRPPKHHDGSPAHAPAPSPTVPPQQREDSIIKHFVNLGIATEAELTTAGTPQHNALTWLAFYDEPFSKVPSTMRLHSRFVERYALAVFYFATNGPAWTFKMNFLSGIDHCDWNDDFLTATGTVLKLGVSNCTYAAESDLWAGGKMVTGLSLRKWFLVLRVFSRVMTMGGRRQNSHIPLVVFLHFVAMNLLAGSFPTETTLLYGLQSIFTPFNPQLAGNLDFGLTTMKSLTYFESQYCGLTGTIPSDIGSMTKLTTLALGNNHFGGTTPDSLFELTNLVLLGLDDNMLEGNIEPFGQLTNLKHVYMADNLFTGQLTDILVAAWSEHMRELDLSTNMLNSTLPASLFNMTNLLVVDLHGNNFRGSLPDIASSNNVIEFVAFYDNQLTGQIPLSISKLENLRHLDLARNHLASPLPDTIGAMTHLKYLYIGQNDFYMHEFPSFMFSLTNLQELSMKNATLTGSIPHEIRTLTQLKLLDLDANMLTGSIPEEVGLMNGLEYLLLNRNSLTGTLPTTFTLLYGLSEFTSNEDNLERIRPGNSLISHPSFFHRTFTY